MQNITIYYSLKMKPKEHVVQSAKFRITADTIRCFFYTIAAYILQ